MATLLLAACDTQEKPEFGQIGAVEGFIGGVVAEEPHAALAARDALSAGGTAADAMATAFFTMLATYPVAVSLGGGGVCLYYDAVTNTGQTLDFSAGRPAEGGEIAVPGALRGIALLHSRYGRLQWGQLIRAGETLARFGHPVSRALATRLAAARERIKADPFLSRTYLRPDGSPLREGDELFQVELAVALTRARGKGVSDVYGGLTGREFVAAANEAGSPITLADLRNYRPEWRDVRKREFGDIVAYFTLPPPVSGEIVHALAGESDDEEVSAGVRQAMASLAVRGLGDQGSAAVVVADRNGSSAACTFSVLGEFGTGRAAPTLGVTFAPTAGIETANYAAVLGVNENNPQTFFAAAGSGGVGAITAVAKVTKEVLAEGLDLEAGMSAALRGQRAGGLAPTASPGAQSQLPASAGRVQAIWCSLGVQRAPKTCEFRTDPGAHGLAAAQVF